MKIILCLDDKNGMLFNRRRQSMDSALRTHVLNMTAGKRLWMNAYSAAQFEGAEASVTVSENFLAHAEKQDYCFVEDADISAYAHKVTEVIIYRWNRLYPRDMVFQEELFAPGWKLVSKEDFPGNSHNILTQEVYSL